MVVVLTVVLLVSAAAATGVGGAAGADRLSAVLAALVGGLGTVAAQVMIVGGLFRLVLRPEEPAFLHLRLGRDEGRLVVVALAWLIAALLLGGLAETLARAASPAWARVAVDVAALVLGVWLTLRFSLAAPISFAERRIDFGRSWALTRGRAGALFGMSLLSLCLVGMAALAAVVVMFAIAAAASGLQGVAAVLAGADGLQRHPGIYLLEFAGQVVLTPVLWVLGAAPLAAAYQALSNNESAA